MLFVSGFLSLRADAQFIATIAGTGSMGYSGDGGAAGSAKFNGPTGLAVDGAGNIYIADNGNNVVRKINTTGIVTTFAGTGTAGYSGNGAAATAARLNGPMALAADAAGNVYIADNGNNVVRVVNAAGIIRNYAGNAIGGYSGDGDTAHLGSLKAPAGLFLDQTGNLYIADASNNVIRKVTNGTRIISTVAGNGMAGSGGDGGMATDASLNSPSGIAVDASGNMYIADVLNHRVRKVTAATGVISTIAGTGAAGNTGDGGPATSAAIRYPSSVSLDWSGNVYFTDNGNYNVRMVNGAGMVSHVAGTSTIGYDGDGGPAVSATLSSPRTVFVDGWNRVYIADQGNHVIRALVSGSGVAGTPSQKAFYIYPNPATGAVTIEHGGINGAVYISVADVTGRVVLQMPATGAASAFSTSSLPGGVYMVTVTGGGAAYMQKLVIAK